MTARLRTGVAAIAFTAIALGASGRTDAQVHDELLGSLRWRSIGPFRGGRVTTVAGVPGQPQVYYLGATGGGVWKTTDAGLSWHVVSDGFFKTGSVGAIAVAPSDPNVIYVGMGEVCARSDASHGDGVYKSLDGGRTWINIGLRDSRHIGQIRVHPTNPDLLYVAALGHLFGPNEERGVYRSADSGRTWHRVLFVDNKTGAVDLAVDPSNPRVLFAATWQVLRTPWGVYSIGAGGGLYRSIDGGENWIRMEAGLPAAAKGRIGVAISPVQRGRVWALVEAEHGGGLFRSDDGGATWRQTTDDFQMTRRAYYYAHVFADTRHPDTVYVLTSPFLKSTDGGRTFVEVEVPHGDNHALWIAPEDNLRMINGNDGGANVSFDAGESWTTQENQGTAQFYHVVTDDQFPYRIYGSQQDNTTVSIPNRGLSGGIDVNDWYPVGGGESGYIAPHPKDPNIVFGGSYYGHLTRYDHRTGETRNISVWPVSPAGSVAADVRYRFQWTFPIFVSRHEPHAVYTAANVLFRSLDEGQSWEAISPDLTRDDETKQRDERLSDYYDTIFAAAESPLRKGLIWIGTDDGLVHLTRNDGKTWEKVTPPQMEAWTRVSIIEPSHFDPGTAYVAANRYQLDDYRPYIYKTTDYGRTWSVVVTGLPSDEFVRVLREDPARRGLLFAGTEQGVWVSADDGARWRSLQLNLPAVPVHDLAVKNGDLIAGTHGRAFWVLDDLSVLEQFTAGTASSPLHLFKPRPTYRLRGGRRRGGPRPLGENPREGVVVQYLLAAPARQVTLEFLDASGKVIRTFSNVAQADAASGGSEAVRGRRRGATPVTSRAGVNLFEWDMRYPDAVGIRGGTYLFGGTLRGPVAVPGSYRVRVTADGRTAEEAFAIRADPRITTTAEDLRKQFDYLIRVRDRLTETHEAVNEILQLRDDVESTIERARGLSAGQDIVSAAQRLDQSLGAVLDELVELRFRGIDDQMLLFPLKLNVQIASLQGVAASADRAPTAQSEAAFEALSSTLNKQLGALGQIKDTEVAALNEQARNAGLPAVGMLARPATPSDRVP